MKNLSAILFITGLVIEAIAFFISNAEPVPFVYRIISPAYYHANKGIDILSEKKVLESRECLENLWKSRKTTPAFLKNLNALSAFS